MQLDWPSARELECHLNAAPFMGVPIGSTLSTFLALRCVSADMPRGALTAVAHTLRSFHRYFNPKVEPEPEVQYPRGRVLVTWLDDVPRINELVWPIIQQIGPGHSLILAGDTGIKSRLTSEFNFVDLKAVANFDCGAWRRALPRHWVAWRRILRQFAKTKDIPIGTLAAVKFQILLHTQLIAGSHLLLDRIGPKAVLTEYDRSPLGSCVVGAARSRGIPTFTLVHGVPTNGAFGFVPFVAETVFCWGEIDRQIFSQSGADPEQLVIAGCPRLSRDLNEDRLRARARLTNEAERKVVLLATNPIPMAHRMRLVEEFCCALKKAPAFLGVVRLHPAETIEFYETYIKRHRHVTFIANDVLPTDVALAASDIVVVHNSGFGVDALVKGLLVVVFDVLDWDLGYGRWLVLEGGCSRAKTGEELLKIIVSLANNKNRRSEQKLLSERCCSRICASFGEESAGWIASQILSRSQT